MEADGESSSAAVAATGELPCFPSEADAPGHSPTQAGQPASCQLASSPCFQADEFDRRGSSPELGERAAPPVASGGESGTRAVHCDSCLSAVVPATRLCLKCEMAFCKQHLRPHLLNPRLSGHPLVRPGESAGELACATHGELLRFYCREDECPVCPLCAIAGDHRSHAISTVQAEHAERKELISKETNVNQEKSEDAVDVVRGLEAVRVTVECLALWRRFLKDATGQLEAVALQQQERAEERRSQQRAEQRAAKTQQSGTDNAVEVKGAIAASIAATKAALDEDERAAVSHVDAVVNSVLAQIHDNIAFYNDRITNLRETNDRLQVLMDENDSLTFLKTFKMEKDRRDSTIEQPQPREPDLGKISSLHWTENVLCMTKVLKNQSLLGQCALDETLPEAGGGLDAECPPQQPQEGSTTPVTAAIAATVTAATAVTAEKPRKKKIGLKSAPGVTAGDTETPSTPAPPHQVPATTEASKAAAATMKSALASASLVGFSPTLDPNSAHPRLALSHDLKTATRTKKRQGYPPHAERFDGCVQALCRERLSKGRHSWELQVGAEEFRVGIAYGTAPRQGLEGVSGLGSTRHSWCLQGLAAGYNALHEGKRFPVKVRQALRKVGVYVDYEMGTLVFYHPDSMTLLYMFNTSFTESVYPAMWVGNGSITIL